MDLLEHSRMVAMFYIHDVQQSSHMWLQNTWNRVRVYGQEAEFKAVFNMNEYSFSELYAAMAVTLDSMDTTLPFPFLVRLVRKQGKALLS